MGYFFILSICETFLPVGALPENFRPATRAIELFIERACGESALFAGICTARSDDRDRVRGAPPFTGNVPSRPTHVICGEFKLL